MYTRRATEGDLEFLVGLRNDPESVRYSSRGVLTPEQVNDSFLNNPNTHPYIARDGDHDIGYIICDGKSTGYWISVVLHPDQRGKGYGGSMMKEAARLCIECHGATEALAHVHPTNVASNRAMEKVGFTITHRDDPFWTMAYKPKLQDHGL